MDRHALLVVDMQNDFITGSLGTKEAQAIVSLVKEQCELADQNGWEVFFTQDTHEDDYLETEEGKHLPIKHCIRDTEGWGICEELMPYVCRASALVEKNSFGSVDLVPFLEGFDSITLVGLCTDICVMSNAIIMKSAFPEIPVRVIASCCAGTTPEHHETALRAMQFCQIDVI